LWRSSTSLKSSDSSFSTSVSSVSTSSVSADFSVRNFVEAVAAALYLRVDVVEPAFEVRPPLLLSLGLALLGLQFVEAVLDVARLAEFRLA